ncbi:MAG: hypothetical protein ACYDGR_06905 [Candidatus Dormibacteria bacterium]
MAIVDRPGPRARLRAGALATTLAMAVADGAATQLISAIELIWRCEGCGYQRWSSLRPGMCPACAAGPQNFTGMTAVEWRQMPAVPAPASTGGAQ